MTHPFFDDLKIPDAKMPTGKDLPPLFNFTREGALAFRKSRSGEKLTQPDRKSVV